MIRIGVDFGGSKIEAAALNEDGGFVARTRAPNPGDYAAAIDTVRRLVLEVERTAGVAGSPVGIGMPGSLSPRTGLLRNANSVWLNGRAFDKDVERALGRPVRLQNDANCFVLSEAVDGAGKDAGVVFGAILGTGCGGSVAVNGGILEGRNRIGGEWGHTPLPWLSDLERGAHRCWCGRMDCLETWLSGSAFSADHEDRTGRRLTGEAIMTAVRGGDADAVGAFERYLDRLGRALAVICDIFDPDIIVCGGGMSNAEELYARVPSVIARHVFSDSFTTPILKARHGDSSGVRGAAWLWPLA